jgi:hypothetical protein
MMVCQKGHTGEEEAPDLDARKTESGQAGEMGIGVSPAEPPACGPGLIWPAGGYPPVP